MVWVPRWLQSKVPCTPRRKFESSNTMQEGCAKGCEKLHESSLPFIPSTFGSCRHVPAWWSSMLWSWVPPKPGSLFSRLQSACAFGQTSCSVLVYGPTSVSLRPVAAVCRMLLHLHLSTNCYDATKHQECAESWLHRSRPLLETSACQRTIRHATLGTAEMWLLQSSEA